MTASNLDALRESMRFALEVADDIAKLRDLGAGPELLDPFANFLGDALIIVNEAMKPYREGGASGTSSRWN